MGGAQRGGPVGANTDARGERLDLAHGGGGCDGPESDRDPCGAAAAHRGVGASPRPCHGLRVGLVCYPSHGGSGVVATELARELARRGHCAHVISYQVPFRLGGHGVQDNVAFHQVEVPTHPLFQYPPYVPALADKIAEVARYEQLDLLHVHYAVPHAVSAALARAMVAPAPLPIVVTLHGTDVVQTGVDPGIRGAVTWSLRQSEAVTAVSDSLAAAARDAFGLKGVRRIYNFIDPVAMRRRPNPELRARFARPDEAVLVHASNFRPVKNVTDVVRVFARVLQRQPAVLILCGDGPEAGSAHRLARELGVEDLVHFVGVQDDIARILSIADLFLLPSQYESFGLVALEAMACEVPVICSRVGGLPEVVTDERAGYLCPAGDVGAMATAAVAALEPRRHAELARGARRLATHRFSANRILPQIETLYAQVARGRHRDVGD